MTTKLNGVLKRELSIGGEPYTLTLSEQGFTLTLKGRRKGLDIRWADLVGGDAALATALNASLTANIAPRGKPVQGRKDECRPAQAQVKPAAKAGARAKAVPRTNIESAATPGDARSVRPRTKARPRLPRRPSSSRPR